MERLKHAALFFAAYTIVCAEAQTTEAPIKFHPTNCKITSAGHEYAGPLSYTINNRTCQAWNVSDPHQNYYTESTHEFPEGSATGAGNQCRNPTPDWHEGVWCYTTDPAIRWETCTVKFCECKMATDPQGHLYEGEISTTVSGRPCQRWASRSPHSHSFNRDRYFPDESVSGASNYCRNPNGTQPDGPWCFTTDPAVTWEYCFIPVCYFSVTELTTASSSSRSTASPSPTPSPTPPRPTSPFHWPNPPSPPTFPPLVWNSDIPKLEPEGLHSSKVGGIVGGIGGACLILLIIALVIFCRRRPEVAVQIRNKLTGLVAVSNNNATVPPTPADVSGDRPSSVHVTPTPSPGISRPDKQPSFDNPIYDQPKPGSHTVPPRSVEAANGTDSGTRQTEGSDRITMAGENKVSFVALGNVDFA